MSEPQLHWTGRLPLLTQYPGIKPIIAEWTIVLAGSWNLAILNPDWFARKILETKQINVELILENIAARLRFMHETLVIIPGTDRVIFGVREPTRDALQLAERTADRLLAELPVTPVTAVGINFGFSIEEPSMYLADIFRLADLNRFAERELLIEETGITRQIAYDDRAYNLAMSLDAEGKVKFKANYHKQVDSAETAREAIRGKPVVYCDHTACIISDFYGSDAGGDDG